MLLLLLFFIHIWNAQKHNAFVFCQLLSTYLHRSGGSSLATEKAAVFCRIRMITKVVLKVDKKRVLKSKSKILFRYARQEESQLHTNNTIKFRHNYSRSSIKTIFYRRLFYSYLYDNVRTVYTIYWTSQYVIFFSEQNTEMRY